MAGFLNKNSNITELRCNNILGDIDKITEEISLLQHVTTVDLTSSQVTDKSASNLAKSTTIKTLILCQNPLTDKGCLELAKNKILEKLFLGMLGGMSSGLIKQKTFISNQTLAEFGKSKNLKNLRLAHNELGDHAAKLLASNDNSITSLDLFQCNITEVGLEAFFSKHNLLTLDGIFNERLEWKISLNAIMPDLLKYLYFITNIQGLNKDILFKLCQSLVLNLNQFRTAGHLQDPSPYIEDSSLRCPSLKPESEKELAELQYILTNNVNIYLITGKIPEDVVAGQSHEQKAFQDVNPTKPSDELYKLTQNVNLYNTIKPGREKDAAEQIAIIYNLAKTKSATSSEEKEHLEKFLNCLVLAIKNPTKENIQKCAKTEEQAIGEYSGFKVMWGATLVLLGALLILTVMAPPLGMVASACVGATGALVMGTGLGFLFFNSKKSSHFEDLFPDLKSDSKLIPL